MIDGVPGGIHFFELGQPPIYLQTQSLVSILAERFVFGSSWSAFIT